MATKSATRAENTLQDARWPLVVARAKSADGSFFYGVESTGVYCRPSCAARRPRPENVRFFATSAEAERAGFRACKRCHASSSSVDERQAALVAELCRMLRESEVEPSLAQLAAHAGLSTFHTHRLFKSVMGITPRAYASIERAARVGKQLKKAGSVTEAIYSAGYSSSARFYEQAPALLGMTPSQYRAGGEAQHVRYAIDRCSLGQLLVAATERGLCAILLDDDAEALTRDLRERFPRAEISAADDAFQAAVQQVVALVEQPERGLSLPLDLRGTAFQRRVWELLQAIPPGETRSYRQLAQQMGAERAVRAVASACARNPLAVAVPCHRVVRTSGDLAGYRWGLSRKRALLEREKKR